MTNSIHVELAPLESKIEANPGLVGHPVPFVCLVPSSLTPSPLPKEKNLKISYRLCLLPRINLLIARSCLLGFYFFAFM